MALNLILFLVAAFSVVLLGSTKRLPTSWLPLLVIFSIVTLHSFINLFGAPPGGLSNANMEQSTFLLMLAALSLIYFRAAGASSFTLKSYSGEIFIFLVSAVLFSVSRSMPVGRQVATLVWLASFAGISWFGFLVWTRDVEENSSGRTEVVLISRVLAAMLIMPFLITVLVNVVPPDNYALPYAAPVAASKLTLILFIIAYMVMIRQTLLFVARLRQKSRNASREVGNLA